MSENEESKGDITENVMPGEVSSGEAALEEQASVIQEMKRLSIKPPLDESSGEARVVEPEQSNHKAKHLVFVKSQEDQYQKQMSERIKEIEKSLLKKDNLPRSYYENDEREENTIKMLVNFKRQYTQIYPLRRELLLYPINEFGISVNENF